MKILRFTIAATISCGFATSQLVFNLNIQTAVAQQIPRVEQQNFLCQEAIRSSEVVLRGDENPNLSAREMNLPARLVDISQTYRSYPNNRFLGVMLAVATPAGHDIMNSPRMMQKISQNIISNCNNIGTVLFQSRFSDWIEIYGIIDDQVTRFRCIGEGPAADGQRPVWGEYFCV
jgi:hypothetical protein